MAINKHQAAALDTVLSNPELVTIFKAAQENAARAASKPKVQPTTPKAQPTLSKRAQSMYDGLKKFSDPSAKPTPRTKAAAFNPAPATIEAAPGSDEAAALKRLDAAAQAKREAIDNLTQGETALTVLRDNASAADHTFASIMGAELLKGNRRAVERIVAKYGFDYDTYPVDFDTADYGYDALGRPLPIGKRGR